MVRAVSPDDMREFLASGNVNRKHNDRVMDNLAAGVAMADPEMTQVITAAALCFTSKHFDEFAEGVGLDKSGKALVKLWLTSTALLTTNGANAMRKVREAFSE
jgi:hypothetical protein